MDILTGKWIFSGLMTIYFSNLELLNDYPSLRKLDQNFRQEVTTAIHEIPGLDGTPENQILIDGGSTVKGAA